MSTSAQLLHAHSDLEKYRALKARALMLALAGQCRTPLDAVRFVFQQLQNTELEAALRVISRA